MKELFWIDVKYACYGIETTDRVVTLTPDIAKWMLGKTSKEVAKWLKSKNAIIVKAG